MTIHYIRQEANGNNDGTDWTNAWTQLPSVLKRDDIYYIANGNYGGYIFDDPTLGFLYIYIKKATLIDHGTDNGWQNNYGEGQATFTGWGIQTSYLMIDGQIGGGYGQWESGHGIAVRNYNTHLIYSDKNISFITLRHIEIDGINTTPSDRDLIYLIGGGSDLTMQYMYIHDVGCDIAQLRGNITRFTLEYSKIARNNQSAACHGDVFEYNSGTALNWVHRYNWFDDCEGTYLWGTHENGIFDSAEIYGNIISDGHMDNGLISALSSGGIIKNLKLYNNTIFNVGGNNAGFQYIRGSNNLIYNNIWYNSPCQMSGIQHDYNWFYSSGEQSETHIQNGNQDIFVNSINHDFRLSSGTDSGLILDNPYNIDILNNIRGADGVWDRGAFEYVSNEECPTPIASFTLNII